MTSLQRKIQRREQQELKKKMKIPKLKAIEVDFGDEKLIVHEPKGREGFKLFLQAVPALSALGKIFSSMDEASDGVLAPPPTIPDFILDAIYPLLGVMTELTAEQFEELGVTAQLAVLRGLSLFSPKNPSAVIPENTQTESTPTP